VYHISWTFVNALFDILEIIFFIPESIRFHSVLNIQPDSAAPTIRRENVVIKIVRIAANAAA